MTCFFEKFAILIQIIFLKSRKNKKLPDYRRGLVFLQPKVPITFEDIPGFQMQQDYKQIHLAPKGES